MLGSTLISKHSARNLDANQAAAQTSTTKVRPRPGEKNSIICLSYFFLHRMGVGCHTEADRASVFKTGSTTQ